MARAKSRTATKSPKPGPTIDAFLRPPLGTSTTSQPPQAGTSHPSTALLPVPPPTASTTSASSTSTSHLAAHPGTNALAPHPASHWRDYYPSPLPPSDSILPEPISGIRVYSTKWKRDNPNPKSAEGRKAMYGAPGMMGMGGMYPGMGMGLGGMYPGMGMGMMGGYPGMYGGMGYGGMMGGGYGMPRYPGGYAGYGGGMYGGMDPYMMGGGYGMPPAALVTNEFPDAHRIEHAYRQSAPDNYGIGMGAMGGIGGGMGLNNFPGSQMLLYGRGGMGMGGYGGWYA